MINQFNDHDPNKVSLAFYKKYARLISENGYRKTYMLGSHRVTFIINPDKIWVTHYYDNFKVSDLGIIVHMH